MQRQFVFVALVCSVLCLLAAPAVAGDKPDQEMKDTRISELQGVQAEIDRLQKKADTRWPDPYRVGDDDEMAKLQAEIKRLQARADAIESQTNTLLQKEVESYLKQAAVHDAAEGAAGLEGITISARLTVVFLATLDQDPSNTHAVGADVDLDFMFNVTDNLDLFINLTANTGEDGHFPEEYGAITKGSATLSGVGDGIGVDGTVSPHPGSVRLAEAGVQWAVPVSDRTLYVMWGKLDPRNYYAQNAFADDENTQFLNNLFDDPPAMTWLTTSAGATVYGLQGWMEFGENYTVIIGWFNFPGQWANNGVLHWQVAWKGEFRGREMNIRLYGMLDTLPEGAAVGISWDWWVNEQIGVFARITVHDNQGTSDLERNHIESDWTAGVQINGPWSQRPDDRLGIAVGYIKGPIRAFSSLVGATENHEGTVEIYYMFSLEDNKLQVTALAQYIWDPGGATFCCEDLYLLGLRIHVPF